mgnify:CR=1 FL=1
MLFEREMVLQENADSDTYDSSYAGYSLGRWPTISTQIHHYNYKNKKIINNKLGIYSAYF